MKILQAYLSKRIIFGVILIFLVVLAISSLVNRQSGAGTETSFQLGGTVKPNAKLIFQKNTAEAVPIRSLKIWGEGRVPDKKEKIQLFTQNDSSAATFSLSKPCGTFELILTYSGGATLTCDIEGGERLLVSSENPDDWAEGYEGVAYPRTKKGLVFRLSHPTPIELEEFTLFVRNYRNREDMNVQVDISSDGVDYLSLPPKRFPYTERYLTWERPRSVQPSRELYIKLSPISLADPLIGVDRFRIIVKAGEQDKFWDTDNPLRTVLNRTAIPLTVEATEMQAAEKPR